MSLSASLGIAWMLVEATRLRRGTVRFSLAVLAPLVLWRPALLALVPVAAGWWAWQGLSSRRRRRSEASEELPLLAELTGLALTAGLPTAGALEAAARHLGPELRGQVVEVLRRARHTGLTAALAESGGAARRLWILLARAQHTGAPLGQVVSAFLDELRDEDRTRRLEAARRLPVRLLIPLALLILPGLALLVVGPGLLVSLGRLAQ